MNEDSGVGVFLSGNRISDMRPKEVFACVAVVRLQCDPCHGCRVERFGGKRACDVLRNGKVLEIDADERLAFVQWEGEKRGWWYLKDLKILGYLFATNVKKTRVPEELIEGALWR